MGKSLSDVQIRAWIRNKVHFSGRSDGNGLTLSFPEGYLTPVWYLRYSFDGKRDKFRIGSYSDFGLATARERARELNRDIEAGKNPKVEKQIAIAVTRQMERQQARTVNALFLNWKDHHSRKNLKHPQIDENKILKDIIPVIGTLPVAEVTPADVRNIIQRIIKRKAPTVANDILRLGDRLYKFAQKDEWVPVGFNPFGLFDQSDAGGVEKARERWLTDAELRALFKAMSEASGWSVRNDYAVRLLLMLGVRKMELLAARVDEFDLDNATWFLPAARTKTQKAVDIPLPTQAVELIRMLISLSSSSYLFPVMARHSDNTPAHMGKDTLNAALNKAVRPLMAKVDPFTVHDLRRTTRTHLAALGVQSHIAERCLNHFKSDVEAVYDRHAYFDERKVALQGLANHLQALERGADNVVGIKSRNLSA